MRTTYTVSVDVGGTFTDAFLSDGSRIAKGKARTTGHDLSVGFLSAVADAAQSVGLDPDTIFEFADHVMYSTTVGTNALVERIGPQVGLITTRGQEETLHLGRSRSWADGMPHEVQMDRTRAHRPPDLVPRALRVGVRERIDCFGNVVMPLQPDDVLEGVDALIEQGAQAIAVCLTWSFMNPDHERMVRDVVRANYPDAYLGRTPVLLSSEVAPKLDEYRRTVTTVLAAFLATATEEHVLDVIDRLHERGYLASALVGSQHRWRFVALSHDGITPSWSRCDRRRVRSRPAGTTLRIRQRRDGGHGWNHLRRRPSDRGRGANLRVRPDGR